MCLLDGTYVFVLFRKLMLVHVHASYILYIIALLKKKQKKKKQEEFCSAFVSQIRCEKRDL
jgi:hypothetical protein